MDRNEIIHTLEKRTVKIKFTTFTLFLYIKGKHDSKCGKVKAEIMKYQATLDKFIEEEFKNLSTAIYPIAIPCLTKDTKASSNDPRKAKRQSTKMNSDKAFVDTAINIVIRLSLSAQEYTLKHLANYIKFTSMDLNEIDFKKYIYEELYDNFVNHLLKGDDVNV